MSEKDEARNELQRQLNAQKKLTIISKVDPALTLECQFNPATMSFTQGVSVKPHENQKNDPTPELLNTQPRNLSLELHFDGDEACIDVEKKYVRLLDELATNAPSKDKEDKEVRGPHQVMLQWGESLKFEGIIESVGVNYTKFAPSGMPTRATVSLKLKETGPRLIADWPKRPPLKEKGPGELFGSALDVLMKTGDPRKAQDVLRQAAVGELAGGITGDARQIAGAALAGDVGGVVGGVAKAGKGAVAAMKEKLKKPGYIEGGGNPLYEGGDVPEAPPPLPTGDEGE